MTTLIEPTDRQSPPAAGTAPGPTLGRLVRGELVKVRTTNLWWILAACALVATVLALLVNGLQAHFEIDSARNPPDFGAGFPPGEGPSPEDVARMEAEHRAQFEIGAILLRSAANIYTSGQFFGLMIVMLFGAILVTGEYYHQTATTTFLAAPRRSRVILAKVGAAIVVAGIAWFVTTVIDLSAGTTFFAVEGEVNSLDVWGVQRAVLMNLPAYALWALLGMGLGALIRNQIAATLVGAGLYLIGSQIVQLVFGLVYQFLIKETWVITSMVLVPGVASSVMISPDRAQLWPAEDGGWLYGPPWWVGGLVLLAYGLAATGLGALLVRRRDIS